MSTKLWTKKVYLFRTYLFLSFLSYRSELITCVTIIIIIITSDNLPVVNKFKSFHSVIHTLWRTTHNAVSF